LFLVVPFVAPRVGAFAGCLDFDKTDKHVAQCDGVIGSSLERGKRRFADRCDPIPSQAAQFREIAEEPFQRGSELVLGLASRSRIRKLRSSVFAKSGDDSFQVRHFVASGACPTVNDDPLSILLNTNK
jgi:hypothetical protein